MFKKMITLALIGLFTATGVYAEEDTAHVGYKMASERPETEGETGFAGSTLAGGYVGAVSEYIWRGVPQTDPGMNSIQGGMDWKSTLVDGLGYGIWLASVSAAMETDYYLAYNGSAGDLGYVGSLTLYSYDFAAFKEVEKTAGELTQVTFQKEIKLGVSYAGASFAYYQALGDDSTYGTLGDDSSPSFNWMELAYSTSIAEMPFSINYGSGSYNHQWLASGVDTVQNTSLLTYSLSKTISSNITVSYNGTKVLGNVDTDTGATALDDQFWLAISLAY